MDEVASSNVRRHHRPAPAPQNLTRGRLEPDSIAKRRSSSSAFSGIRSKQVGLKDKRPTSPWSSANPVDVLTYLPVQRWRVAVGKRVPPAWGDANSDNGPFSAVTLAPPVCQVPATPGQRALILGRSTGDKHGAHLVPAPTCSRGLPLEQWPGFQTRKCQKESGFEEDEDPSGRPPSSKMKGGRRLRGSGFVDPRKSNPCGHPPSTGRRVLPGQFRCKLGGAYGGARRVPVWCRRWSVLWRRRPGKRRRSLAPYPRKERVGIPSNRPACWRETIQQGRAGASAR